MPRKLKKSTTFARGCSGEKPEVLESTVINLEGKETERKKKKKKRRRIGNGKATRNIAQDHNPGTSQTRQPVRMSGTRVPMSRSGRQGRYKQTTWLPYALT